MASDGYPRVLYLSRDGRERITARAGEWEFEHLGADSMGVDCWQLKWRVDRAGGNPKQGLETVYVLMARAALVALEESTARKETTA